MCISSDGEAKRGDAIVMLTMKHPLPESSPIHPLLGDLKLMNLLVGDDDLTGDKDYKHGIKVERNLMMRDRGILIQGYLITPTILKEHLHSNGVEAARLRSLLNPNDKQDVYLALSLLKEIWSLGDPPPNSTLTFVCAHTALRVYRHFVKNLTMPYICVDYMLSEQLISLSTAAHLALYLYTDDRACTAFLPNQTYVNLMMMIKNVYFCIAKYKVDIPKGQFYIILLGTDRLEGFLALIRCAVGTDSNVDILQLGN